LDKDNGVEITNIQTKSIELTVNGKQIVIAPNKSSKVELD
jgi:hypothetical protein